MGDIGCSAGPWITGLVSDFVEKNTYLLKDIAVFDGISPEQLALKCGLFIIIVFPVLMTVCLVNYIRNK
jgi:hypothetical protein